MIKRLVNKSLILTITTMLCILNIAFTNSVKAEGNYKVYNIEPSGTKTEIGSYDDLDSAKEAMKGQVNGVVENSNICYSNSNIIAMTRGLAISYTFRENIKDTSTNISTVNIYQDPNFTTSKYKSTYVASYNEMTYLDTIINDNGLMVAKVNLDGFIGYINLKQVDLIPYVYYENDLEFTVGGNSYDGKLSTYTTHVKRSRFYTTSNGELVYKSYSYISDNTKTLETTVGLKASFMSNSTTYYSPDHINYYSDIACTNYVGTYYNYYEFLPLRTKSNLSASDFDDYLMTLSSRRDTSVTKDKGNLFISAQNTYGINALLLYSIHALESGWGTSNLAINKNNLFGWAAYDDNTDNATTFSSIENCINEMAGINLRRYVDTRNTVYFGSHLGNKSSGINVKYCSGQNWGLEIASIAYKIDRASGYKDYQAYNLGIVKNDCFATSFYSEPSTNSTVLYTSEYGSTYQKDFTVAILSQENNFYEVTSTQPLQNKTNVVTDITERNLVTYDYDQSKAYVNKDNVNVISLKGEITVKDSIKEDLINNGDNFSITTFEFTEDGLNIAGYAYNNGIPARLTSYLTHELVIVNTSDNSETKFILNNTILENYETTNNIDYSYGGFSLNNIDLKNVANGKYKFAVRTSYTNYDYSFDSTINLETLTDASSYVDYFTLTNEENVTYLNVRYKEQKDISASVRTIEWTEDNKLHIQGTAVLKGLPLTDKSKIVRKLIVTNVSDNSSVEYNLDIYSHEDLNAYNYNILDNVNYYYAWYDTNLDIASFEYGDYLLSIYVEVTDENDNIYYNSKYLTNTLLGKTPGLKTLENKTIFVDKNGRKNSRYEISIFKGMSEKYSSIVKPTEKRTCFSLSNLTISETGTLNLNGFMYICNIDHDIEQMPSYNLLLVKDGVIIKNNELTSYTGSYNISQISGVSYNYEYAWYKGENIDLTTLENGTYDIYLTDTVGEYFDLMSVYGTNTKFNQTITVNNKVYETTITNTYNRIQLVVKDAEVQ